MFNSILNVFLCLKLSVLFIMVPIPILHLILIYDIELIS